MMRSRRRVWAGAAVLVLGGCKDYHPLSSGVGTLGEPCWPTGALACDGHAQQVQLICGPDARWTTNGTCTTDTLCDTTVGQDQGTCKPVLAGCEGKTAD